MSTHEHSGPIIYQVVGSFPPHDLSGLRVTPGQPPCSAPMIPWSWISITATTHVLHAHLAAPSTSFCCVICWVTHMPWTVLRPSFRSCQVEPTTCTSRCALSNSHLRAGCQCLHCRIRICVQDVNVYAAEFRDSPSSHQPIPPWRVLLSGLDIPSSSPCSSTIYAADFPLTNLQLHKSALPIYAPVGMAASTPRHCFGQSAEICTSCKFDTVTTCLFQTQKREGNPIKWPRGYNIRSPY